MRVSEAVAATYFAYLIAVAVFKPAWPAQRRALAISALMLVIVLTATAVLGAVALELVRDWVPGLYLLAGYWVSGLFFVTPMTGIEAAFLRADARLFESGPVSAFLARGPRLVFETLEAAYLGCVVFIPAGLLVLIMYGHQAAADRFWTLVLVAEFGAFAMLPWVQTRPPRSIVPPAAVNARPVWMRRGSLLMVQNTSIGVNTFPSGHVAGSLAVATCVASIVPAASPLMLAIAALITIATVIGRYHYAVDALAALPLVLFAWAVVWGTGI